MNNRELLVSSFEYKTKVAMPFHRMCSLRRKLIEEESMEVEDELAKIAYLTERLYKPSFTDEAALLKELCDLQYVLSGTIYEMGLSPVFDEAFQRVHDNNMSKIKDGFVVREDGKVTKPKDYKKVELEDLIAKVRS